MEAAFWINQGVKFFAFLFIAYAGGLLVSRRGVRTNYTRKINHFFLFFLPVFLDDVFGYEKTMPTTTLSMLLLFSTLVMYARPFRERVPFIKTAFLSFDRPEDRPYTMLWLSTQIAAAIAVIIPVTVYCASIGKMNLIYIPILITGIGDGLAEPVGVRFGRHKYQVYALFTKKKFVRSLEGSACVFVVSIITVLLLRDNFSAVQFYTALTGLPILMTMTEAFSPHTWDGPFMCLVAGLSIYGLEQLSF